MAQRKKKAAGPNAALAAPARVAAVPVPPPVLRLADRSAYQAPLAQWPLPLGPPFMGSRELDLLKADLEHYVDGRVRGRSYLIAGHRGAGKTTLVARAIDQVATSIMRQSVSENPENLHEGPLQRPLMVKLHGPSMLAPQSPRETGGKAPAAPDNAAAVGEPEAGGAAAAANPAGQATAAAHAALVQITLGLYRALAGEAATGFRAHALYQSPEVPGDQAELSAQLSLDLDGGAPPALLRQYWAALGRLQRGVFWPATADPTCAQHGMADQGLREIAALATAGQAFQVCTGRISYETKINQSTLRKLTSELKGASDVKNSLNQLGTLGIGALTGVTMFGGAHSTPLGALAAGLGVWLLGSASLSWSRSTERNANRSVEYSFIRDFTIETLERDLPVVINRTRDAGLVPVFVIDELDKVDDAPKELKVLIARLKHLIADFGFFCFLVNRDCFEAIEARIRSGAYPAEHTLFSERLLLRSDPDHALRYLTGLVEGDADDPQFAIARATFALTVMHRAQLNLTEMMRQLARAAMPSSTQIGTAVELTEPRRLVIATVQIAINETLRNPALAARMDADARFAQLALDTLYDPSRSWAKGIDIDPSQDALRERLDRRMRPDQEEASAADVERWDTASQPTIDQADLELLQTTLMQLLGYLSNLPSLQAALGRRTAFGSMEAPQAGDVRLADIVPANIVQICRPLPKYFYRFAYNRDGELAQAGFGRLDPDQRARARMLLDYAEKFEALLAAVGVTFDDVARTPLLKSVSAPLIADAKAGLTTALRLGNFYPAVAEHLSTLERFHAEIGQEAEKIGEFLLLFALLESVVGKSPLILPAILHLVPFELPPQRWLKNRGTAPAARIPGDAAGLDRWVREYTDRPLQAPGDARSELDDQSLAEPLIRYFKNPRTADLLVVDYAFLLAAARGELPAKSMHTRLANMTSGEWSSLAFAAAPRRGETANAPYWMFVAALRGLGFGRNALTELADRDLADDLQSSGWSVSAEGMTPQKCFSLIDRIAATVDTRPSGLLVVETDEDKFGIDRPVDSRPTLIIDRRDYYDYLSVLNWLEALGILGGVAVAGGGLDEVM